MTAFLRRLVARSLQLFRRDRAEDDLTRELTAHLALLEDEYRRRGLPAPDAHRAARLALGGIEQTKDGHRDARALRWVDELVGDVRYAVRGLRRAPGFAAVACLTLALGIGANAAMFSVVDAALFRPLPYRNADRLVDLLQTVQTRGGDRAQIAADARHVADVRAMAQVFDGADVCRDAQRYVRADGPDVWVGGVTATFSDFLGVSPQLGRGFRPDDGRAGDRVLISDAFWRRAFNRDRNVVGKTIAFANKTYVVTGVMPPAFRAFVGAQTDAWVPIADVERDDHVIARIRPGLSLTQAQQELNAIVNGAATTWRPLGLELLPADWNRAGEYFGKGTVSTRTMLLSLLGAVACLLAIACANVGNLLLSRTLTRQKEIAVRRALGAGRARVARQFLTEGVVLAATGAVAAVIVAWWSVKTLPAVVPAKLSFAVFGSGSPELDGRALAFGCLLALVTGVLCGVTPAWRAWHTATADGLLAGLAGGQHVAGSSRRESRMQHALLAVQVAMTVVLLAGAGLLLASLARMVTLPTGFDAEHLGYAGLTRPQYARSVTVAPSRALFDELIVRLRAVPGVRGATFGQAPIGGGQNTPLLIDGRADVDTADPVLESFAVGPDYFRVVGIPLLEGRLFGPEDGPASAPVAIISENIAKRFWPGRSAIGGRFRRWTTEPVLTVVGVVPHIRTINLARDGGEAYTPVAGAASDVVFRATGDPAALGGVIRNLVQAIDPSVSVTSVGAVEELFAHIDPIGPPRFYAQLLGMFAGLGLLVAAVGLYGVLSYSVSRRTYEIGVRIALGAGTVRVRWLMLGEVLLPVVAGVLAGLIAAFWLSRFIASQLFRVTPHDPVTMGVTVGFLVAVCALAAFVPLRRATRIDPVVALRAD